ncbi:MAG: amidohydrolase family protein [Treponema sp.]|nr:amidohydrolase family protein [Treponema sp.]
MEYEKNNFILQGDLCWSRDARNLETRSGAYLVCREGKSAGVFEKIPEEYASFPVIDRRGKLVLPGLTDLHIHAPQFGFRALGMDMELLEWLENRAFPEEAKFGDPSYALPAYQALVEDLKKGPNTRICLYATVHVEATLMLMDLLEKSGLISYVGKVNMDRNCPPYLREESAAASLEATRLWVEASAGGSGRVRPILTPRFIPSCSDGLLRGLGEIREQFAMPLQSHLSETRKEIQWVRELCPGSSSYAGAYSDFGLLGPSSIMAHCVWSNENGEEMDLIARRGVFVAHCPQSNTNLASGIAPARRFLERGVRIGLGSDVAGGAHSSIFRAMSDAIQVSKLRRFIPGGSPEDTLSLEEAFYMATLGGGGFFAEADGKGPGSFEAGYDFDALVVDDGDPAPPLGLSLRDRLERVVYLSENRHIAEKYVAGRRVTGSLPARSLLRFAHKTV